MSGPEERSVFLSPWIAAERQFLGLTFSACFFFLTLILWRDFGGCISIF
jgi:hypothetical protein